MGNYFPVNNPATNYSFTADGPVTGGDPLEFTGTGSGYTAGGTAFSTQSTASSSGSNVTMPGASGTISWTNGSGGNWSIVSLEITDAAPIRVWYGNWNGQPVIVANGNTFQVAAGAISAGGF